MTEAAPYRTVRELVHVHFGRPAVVMGGGPSLPSELERCPTRADAIYVSANDHGARLVGCDYVVALDKIEAQLRPFGVPIVTRHMWADYRIVTPLVPNSGAAAAWVARLLGCAPIFLAGMGCWDPAGGTYFHSLHAENAAFQLPVTEHLRHWQEMTEEYPADYRPIGGPLADHIDGWGAVRPGVVPRETCLLDVAGAVVQFLVDCPHRGREFAAGAQAELPYRHLRELLADRKAVLV